MSPRRSSGPDPHGPRGLPPDDHCFRRDRARCHRRPADRPDAVPGLLRGRPARPHRRAVRSPSRAAARKDELAGGGRAVRRRLPARGRLARPDRGAARRARRGLAGPRGVRRRHRWPARSSCRPTWPPSSRSTRSTVHAWDLAVATGQPYPGGPGRGRRACLAFVQSFEPPAGGAADDGGLFGPPVAVPDDAPALDRLIGATGRDPSWTPLNPGLGAISTAHVAARVPSPAVACPSGLRSTPRKRVWVQAHRGFKSHRHRQPCDVSGHPGQPDLRPVGSAGFVCRVCGGCLVRGVGWRARRTSWSSTGARSGLSTARTCSVAVTTSHRAGSSVAVTLAAVTVASTGGCPCLVAGAVAMAVPVPGGPRGVQVSNDQTSCRRAPPSSEMRS